MLPRIRECRSMLLPLLVLVALLSSATSVAAEPTTPPIDIAVGCPTTAQAGQPVTCLPTIMLGAVSAVWNAPGGSPSFATTTAPGLSFTTKYSTPGQVIITMQGCNVLGCGALLKQTVQITPAPMPSIKGLGCPATTQVGQIFTCTAAVTGTVSYLTWNTSGGSPLTGSGPSFLRRSDPPQAVRRRSSHLHDKTSMRFIPLASATSMGAIVPKNSDGRNEETNEIRVVVSYASGRNRRILKGGK